MKILDNSDLIELSSKLSFENDMVVIQTRAELYSCRMIKADKRLLSHHVGEKFEHLSYLDEHLGQEKGQILCPLSSRIMYIPQYKDNISNLNPNRTHVEVGYGRVRVKSDQRTLCNLRRILSLNYPELDFSDAPGSDFVYVNNLDDIVCEVNNKLKHQTGPEFTHDHVEKLWHTLDDVIEFAASEKYKYYPINSKDYISLTDGVVWHLDYFFYNRKKRRIVALIIICTKNDLNDSEAIYSD